MIDADYDRTAHAPHPGMVRGVRAIEAQGEGTYLERARGPRGLGEQRRVGPSHELHELVVRTLPALDILGACLGGDQAHEHVAAGALGSYCPPQSGRRLRLHLGSPRGADVSTEAAADAAFRMEPEGRVRPARDPAAGEPEGLRADHLAAGADAQAAQYTIVRLPGFEARPPDAPAPGVRREGLDIRKPRVENSWWRERGG